ncbi:hypothetical protein CH252_40590 [Rhodococcus sp. 06-1477-1B]|nr:hypothetical protein CH252_40590 [Rhodococcus sp. 06-1477-1B]
MAGQSVVISVLADTKKFGSDMDGASKTLSGLGKGLAGVGVAAGVMAAAAVVAVGAVVVSAVKAVAEVERLNAQTSAAIASTGGAAGRSLEQITGLADSLERMTGVEAEVIQGAQNMLLTFTSIKGDNFDAATKAALDMSVALGTDATSAATLVGKALNDPIKGIGALSKVGVQLTEDQKNLVKSMVEVGDTAGAQGVILGVLNEQFGGSAEAFGNTFLGAIEKVKNSYGALTEATVQGFLPVMTGALNKLNDWFLKLGDSPAFAKIVDGINSVGLAILDGSFDFSNAIASFNELRDTVIQQAPGIITALIDGLVSAASMLGRVAPQIIAALINGLTAAAPTILTAAVSIVDALVRGVLTGLPALITAAVGLIQALVDGISQNLPTLLTLVAEMIPQIIGALLTAIPQLIIAAQDLIQALVTGVIAAIPVLLEGFSTMWATVIPSILEQYPAVLANGVELFLALVQAIADALPQIVDAMTGAWPAVLTAITNALPQILDAGTKVFLSLVQSVTQALPSILTSVISMSPRIVSSIVQMTPAILAAGLILFREIIKALPIIIPEVMSALRAMGPSMVSALSSIGPSLASAGADIIRGLVRGLQSNAGSVVNSLLGIAKNAIGAFKSFFGIKSPSKLFRQYGGFLVQGLTGGIAGSSSLVDRAMNGLNARLDGGLQTSLNVPAGYSAGGSRSAPGNTGPVIHVTFQSTLPPTAEDGRKVAQALDEYLRMGGTVSFA